ncbi:MULTISPECIES: response regulator transcription factor [unclassified Rhizobium]|uniref:response regulator transcription factor n=1 Tax=unclassified Rhizobium TaxID=2613769 RepID=UPI0021682F66|nr:MULTISPECIES: response regulator [unclassified Rhizobium]MCS3742084.1 FixJ family two-component response regulator [Rhizobium sp. BK661]MCS4093994.1 FixJ family two-component response regulator [Rhizobium sp. BK176]
MKPIVHIVDDDQSYRIATERLLSAYGRTVRGYGSGDEFLACVEDGATGCVLLDLQMPGLSGLEIQQQLRDRAPLLPIVFLTGEGDIKASVEAMKAGAEDFLEKPGSAAVLIETIERALNRSEKRRAQREHIKAQQMRVKSLSLRETSVFEMIVRGQLNKQIAFALGISERTVKVHRHQVMEKLGARSLADVVLIAANAGFVDRPAGGSEP